MSEDPAVGGTTCAGRPRILHTIDSFVTGGAERLLLRFLANSDPAESQVAVLAHKGTAFEEEAIASPVPVEFLAASRLTSLTTWRSAYRLLKASQADIVHTHLQYTTLIFLPLARCLGMKSVVTLHNQDRRSEKWTHRVLNRVELALLRRFADCIIGVGPLVTASWRERLPGREIRTIVNAVQVPDLAACRPAADVRDELGTPRGALVFACVASHTPQKNIGGLLEAFDRARHDMPTSELWLIGDGRLRSSLERKARDMGLLSGGVRFLGVRRDVSDLLAASDAFVLSSNWEGLPVAMLEAMAHARPVIVPDVGDVRTVATPQNALMTTPGDVAELAEALRTLARDPALRRSLGDAARRTVEAGYGEEAWIAELRQVYRDLAETPSGGRRADARSGPPPNMPAP